MRLWSSALLFVLLFVTLVPCLAQQPSGPPTLEDLASTGESQESQLPAGRPYGALIRPADGVKHPDLDKAWADYDEAVEKVAAGMKAAISKQFDTATAKGDLDAAEKWQVIGEKFEKAGELPTESELKAAVSVVAADYKNVREKLSAAYELVVKSLTTEKKIVEAKAARNEAKELSSIPAGKSPSDSSAGGATNLKQPDGPPDRPGKKISLLAIRPVFAFCAWGELARNKPADKKPVINGKECDEFLLAHAASFAQFPVPPNARRLQAIGASTTDSKSMRFIFMTPDGNVLQQSLPLDRCKDGIAELDVAIPAGVKAINLIVDSCGNDYADHAVWCYPRFVLK